MSGRHDFSSSNRSIIIDCLISFQLNGWMNSCIKVECNQRIAFFVSPILITHTRWYGHVDKNKRGWTRDRCKYNLMVIHVVFVKLITINLVLNAAWDECESRTFNT